MCTVHLTLLTWVVMESETVDRLLLQPVVLAADKPSERQRGAVWQPGRDGSDTPYRRPADTAGRRQVEVGRDSGNHAAQDGRST